VICTLLKKWSENLTKKGSRKFIQQCQTWLFSLLTATTTSASLNPCSITIIILPCSSQIVKSLQMNQMESLMISSFQARPWVSPMRRRALRSLSNQVRSAIRDSWPPISFIYKNSLPAKPLRPVFQARSCSQLCVAPKKSSISIRADSQTEGQKLNTNPSRTNSSRFIAM